MAADGNDKDTARAVEPPKLKLYSYWWSSCSHRVRIVLSLKGLDYEYKAVDLLKNEQSNPALEKLLEGCAGRYATGDEVQLADVFLAPQIYAAMLRFRIDMSQFPTLAKLQEAYTEHPDFQAALPKGQPDAHSCAL